MIRRSFRFGLRLGILIGVVFAAVKVLQSRRAVEESDGWASAPEPWRAPTPAPPRTEPPRVVPSPIESTGPAAPTAPAAAAVPAAPAAAPAASAAAPPAVAPKKLPAKKAAAQKEVATTWVTPEADVCPSSHPVKAKMSSRIFHLPGMFAYDRTRPDRCYEDEASAAADGFTKAKR